MDSRRARLTEWLLAAAFLALAAAGGAALFAPELRALWAPAPLPAEAGR